jgi:hypothetical protein
MLTKTMNYKNYFIFIVAFILLSLGCKDKNDQITFTLPDGEKLEDTIPGWFIKSMSLDYSSGKNVKVLMHEYFKKPSSAKLINTYYDDNGDIHLIWQYYDLPGIIDKYWKIFMDQGPFSLNPVVFNFDKEHFTIILEEQVSKDDYSFSFKYPPPGVPWSKMVSADKLVFSKEKKNIVIIFSSFDGDTRLFLYGEGHYCTEIMVY